MVKAMEQIESAGATPAVCGVTACGRGSAPPRTDPAHRLPPGTAPFVLHVLERDRSIKLAQTCTSFRAGWRAPPRRKRRGTLRSVRALELHHDRGDRITQFADSAITVRVHPLKPPVFLCGMDLSRVIRRTRRRGVAARDLDCPDRRLGDYGAFRARRQAATSVGTRLFPARASCPSGSGWVATGLSERLRSAAGSAGVSLRRVPGRRRPLLRQSSHETQTPGSRRQQPRRSSRRLPSRVHAMTRRCALVERWCEVSEGSLGPRGDRQHLPSWRDFLAHPCSVVEWRAVRSGAGAREAPALGG
jgi:hypothetical protein